MSSIFFLSLLGLQSRRKLGLWVIKCGSSHFMVIGDRRDKETNSNQRTPGFAQEKTQQS